jgi:hypothetical protein
MMGWLIVAEAVVVVLGLAAWRQRRLSRGGFAATLGWLVVFPRSARSATTADAPSLPALRGSTRPRRPVMTPPTDGGRDEQRPRKQRKRDRQPAGEGRGGEARGRGRTGLGCRSGEALYETLGWRLDADLAVDVGYRVVQLTPPGSACSIIFGTGVTSAVPGSSEGLQLTVYDIDEARADLVGRGVDVSETFHDVTGIFHHTGTEGRLSGPAPGHADYGSFAAFSDPDGNGWLLQEIKTRLPGR